MSDVRSLPDLKVRFCEKYSGKAFVDYTAYLDHKLKIKNKELNLYLTYEELTERNGDKLKEQALQTKRTEIYQNQRLLSVSEQFICMGRAFPFTIHWRNDRPSSQSSLIMFEDEQMVEQLRKNNWAIFGSSSLFADVSEFDYSCNCFLRIQRNINQKREERIKLLMKDPLHAAIINIYDSDDMPKILMDYKDADFKEGGCALKFIEHYYNLDSTATLVIATRLRRLLFP